MIVLAKLNVGTSPTQLSLWMKQGCQVAAQIRPWRDDYGRSKFVESLPGIHTRELIGHLSSGSQQSSNVARVVFGGEFEVAVHHAEV